MSSILDTTGGTASRLRIASPQAPPQTPIQDTIAQPTFVAPICATPLPPTPLQLPRPACGLWRRQATINDVSWTSSLTFNTAGDATLSVDAPHAWAAAHGQVHTDGPTTLRVDVDLRSIMVNGAPRPWRRRARRQLQQLIQDVHEQSLQWSESSVRSHAHAYAKMGSANDAVSSCGMVLGKFMPPHQGHQYLVEFAQNYVKDLTVVVGTLAAEPIPGAQRFAWMQQLFPNACVVHLTDENPQDPAEHPAFWRIWESSLMRVLPRKPSFVFASEPYGAPLAQVLGAEFVSVDVARSALPISGTQIRSSPLEHWSFIPRCVRPYFVRRVCILGPESTGKSTLTLRLAAHFHTVAVPEYARTVLEANQGAVLATDLRTIARGQIAAEEALALNAQRLLFADTDAVATAVWSTMLFGSTPDWLNDLAASRAATWHLTLLTDPNTPWVQDGIRYQPHQAERQEFFERTAAALRSLGRPFTVLSGDWQQRYEQALDAVASLVPKAS